MFLLEWTASDLILITVCAAALIGTVLWLVPGARVAHKRQYSKEEIGAYDDQVPRYFIAAAVALIIGGLHTVVKNVPGFWQWQWEAGYGGHLFRDLANSHIIIVGGGTVLLTGITWYALPRFVGRPLYSHSMAGASFWFTIIGVFGFYLSWLILGLVEGEMVRDGMSYYAAKESVGAWHRVPTRITSTIMGVGYWAYVLNVFLTVMASRHVRQKPFGYLTKFAVVAAAALFVGTVQGVIQVLPANADWIHFAGRYGEYVDPISHAHINLVTGMIISLTAFVVYFGPKMGGVRPSKRWTNLTFWSLLVGSLLFYFSFLLLGLILGTDAAGYGPMQFPGIVPIVESARPVILAVSGTAMLAGFWMYFLLIWRSLDVRSFWRQARQGKPAAFWLASSFALIAGTTQGLLQTLPATADKLTIPQEIPNIHAQLNMVGGVLLALFGVVYALMPELVGQPVDRRLRRWSLAGVGGGIAAYYLSTLVVGLLRLGYLQSGYTDAGASAELSWVAPLVLMLAAVPILAGYIAFGVGIFRVTRSYRTEVWQLWKGTPKRFTGTLPARVRRMPTGYILAMELAGGLFGWPGIGWLYAGQALPGIGLLLIGPAISWALLPMMAAPESGTFVSQYGWEVIPAWLIVSSTLSTALLGVYITRSRAAERARRRATQTVSSPSLPVTGGSGQSENGSLE